MWWEFSATDDWTLLIGSVKETHKKENIFQVRSTGVVPTEYLRENEYSR